MAYGQGEYGQRGYGGSSFETPGPQITASDPVNGANGVLSADPLSFTIESISGLDINTLMVLVNGVQAVVAEDIQVDFSGAITQPTEPVMVVSLPTHPDFNVGPNQVDITITDLAGLTAVLTFTFNATASETLAESVTVTEDVNAEIPANFAETLGVSEGLEAVAALAVDVSDQVQIEETITTGSFNIWAVSGDEIEVIAPFELHFDEALRTDNYLFVPNLDGDNPGNPLILKDVQLQYTTYQSGSTGAVIPDESAPNVADLSDGVSNLFQFPGTVSTLLNLGDFITIHDGSNAGLYQILEVVEPGSPAVVRLDKSLTLMDSNNGVINAGGHIAVLNPALIDPDPLDPASYVIIPAVELVEVTDLSGGLATPSSRLVFQVNHPSVTEDDPLQAVYALTQRAREQDPSLVALNAESALPPEEEGLYNPSYSFDMSQLVLEDYRTFSIPNPGQPLMRGSSVDPSTLAETLAVVFQLESRVDWSHTSGVTGVSFRTNKMLNNGDYLFQARNLYLKLPRLPFTSDLLKWTAQSIPSPRLESVEVDEEGTVLVTFNEDMRSEDANLYNPGDYTISGGTTVHVKSVQSMGPRAVALTTRGLGDGDYTLTVSTSTPKDVAGNPLDPIFNSAIFASVTPLLNRSIFTDKGPISKPELLLQSGTAATIDGITNISLPGAVLTNDDIGKRVRLSGSATNDTVYKILSVVDTDTVKVQASLIYPDANSGVIDWEVFDPRNGMIADDPADVTVRVNGSPVVPEAVIGLRGQVVLPSTPLPDDDVEIDYCHICNPRVEIRRLNSKEFRLNGWNRDYGVGNQDSAHNYRFNNVLIDPSNYASDDLQANLEAPLLRSLKYRAYERTYTAVLNDPTRLLLNTPIHKIAFPPAQRTLSEASVFYEGLTLPENDATHPWVRKGAGVASVSAGVLTLTDNSTGTFPAGEGLFWTQPLDLTYDHVFSAAWRFSLDSVTTYEGVWTGLAAGYSDESLAYVVGYLEEAGVKKIGFLKRGAEENVEDSSAWIGGVDAFDTPTGAAAELDWSILHSYRIARDQSGTVRLYIDGDVVETLRVLPSEVPALEEVNAPFDEIQGAFFGSLSRMAENSSSWDFYRYLSQPISLLQTAPSSYVSYEANVLPELDPSPWTPVGFHGTSTILSGDFLLLDSTSASDEPQGLIGGDFRGHVKIEPLLSSASQVAIDWNTQLLTRTHGNDPDGLMVAVDDGNRVMQVSYVSDVSAPKVSYGGRSLPEDFSPSTWTSLGAQASSMLGRYLRIQDSSAVDGKVYLAEDTSPIGSEGRIFSSGIDYILEARIKVNSYTVDANGFCGAFAQVFDSTRSVGFMLFEDSGTRYVALHADGVDLGVAAWFPFEWDDGGFHTYRLRKDTGGNLVSLFADSTLLGTADYTDFAAPPPDPIGQLTFGSSTAASTQAFSDVEWAYCNAWRVLFTQRRYVGLWKGTSNGDLTDYHLPVKESGVNASVQGNTLGDAQALFITNNVVSGDLLVVDSGANQGVYEVDNVVAETGLTIVGTWPSGPTQSSYRVIRQTDWSSAHDYRLFKDTSGNVSLFLDSASDALLTVGYTPVDLPVSGTGIVSQMSNGLPAIAFGSFSEENLAQSRWDYVRYGIARSSRNSNIVPPHQVLNQWNVIESPERLYTVIPHVRTDFRSESTGITPSTDPDFLAREDVTAYTRLNEGTPLVPRTQTWEVRGPYTTTTYLAALNDPEDLLNSPGQFILNNGNTQITVEVPNDVLYSSLKVIELEEGSLNLIRPADDECGPEFGSIQYQREVCLDYEATTLPEDDTTAPTPWTINSDNSGAVTASVAAGILTYGTQGPGTKTAYLNNTPLPDAPSLQTEVRFRLKLDQDATLGTGDSQVRFGLSAPGMTIGLGFVTLPSGERHVQAFDLKNGLIVGYATFDYLDGAFHDYRIVRTPGTQRVEIFIDA